MRTAVFTIVSRNYLHYARVLMGSLQATQPSWQRFVVLADRNQGAFDVSAESFTVVEAGELAVPEQARFFFRYTILELNTAVKPWFFCRLFEQGFDRVVFLDPDIFVYAPLLEVEQALAGGALAVLVPHLTGRLRDGARPGEREILQSGAYNLGFCALAKHPELEGLIEFWCEKSLRDFVVDLPRGLFTDQRWMDLVPGMFSDVSILRHEGYDVAYWNLPHRALTRRGADWLVNGRPLVFFHFSGLDAFKPEAFSKHQNRYRLSTLGTGASLVEDYCRALVAADLRRFAGLPYSYGALNDGTPIPDALRRLYRTTPEVERWAGSDPFARTGAEWGEPVDAQWPPLTRVMLALYNERADLRLTWPLVFGRDREAYARWFVDSPELDLDRRAFIEPLRIALERSPLPHAPPTPQPLLPSAPLSVALISDAARKAARAFREGRLPLSPRRWLKLLALHATEAAQATLARESPSLPKLEWPATDGLTVVGYLTDATGVGAGAHASSLACTEAGIAHELIDARPTTPVRGQYRVALLHVNADQTLSAASLLSPEFFRDRYSVGFWAWELDELPDVYLPAFGQLNEVWAPSQFVQRALAEKSPIPVVQMPHCVVVAPDQGLSRHDFGLPEGFIFLSMYDVLSVQERKNPLGAIEAFRRAWPHPQKKVRLVVRVNHAAHRPDDVAVVRNAIAQTPGAMLIERPMSRPEAQALQNVCDAFLSLHRAEGFGLNIAEAMLLGKPVVVTGWSGNLDFTTHENACLVRHQLVTLTKDHGPYRVGSRWAEPELDHAAESMTRLVEEEPFRRQISSRGRITIKEEFSPRAIGQRYARRLAAIRRRF